MFLFFSTCPVGAINQMKQIILIFFSDESRQINYHLENLRNLLNHRGAVCLL